MKELIKLTAIGVIIWLFVALVFHAFDLIDAQIIAALNSEAGQVY